MIVAARVYALAGTPWILLLLLLLGGLVAPNLIAAAFTQGTARLGKEFAIKAGQQLKLDGVDFQVKFAGVPQDSRCPADVNCVWAGNAEVALSLSYDKCTTNLTLNTNDSPQRKQEEKAGDFRVKLIRLDPYPRSDKKIAASDYVATLVITKAAN
jgi:hypothetical protein